MLTYIGLHVTKRLGCLIFPNLCLIFPNLCPIFYNVFFF
jgi:hypothetical protein